jgi:hypothetical protein
MLILNINLFGEIRNGYGIEINGARASLKTLEGIVEGDKNLSIFQNADLNMKVERLRKFITYYELTESLLEQFRAITPGIYHEIDSIKDSKGRPVHVYVKFLPEESMQGGISGTTNLEQTTGDKDAYSSEYGLHTVSITISTVNRCLFLLAHEFGHVKHQVPHLLTYMEFYSTYYQNTNYTSKELGHNSNDPSGQSARAYEKRFREEYVEFLNKTTGKLASPSMLVQAIKKSLVP